MRLKRTTGVYLVNALIKLPAHLLDPLIRNALYTTLLPALAGPDTQCKTVSGLLVRMWEYGNRIRLFRESPQGRAVNANAESVFI